MSALGNHGSVSAIGQKRKLAHLPPTACSRLQAEDQPFLPSGSSRPVPAAGVARQRPFTAKTETREAVARNAKSVFLTQAGATRRLRSVAMAGCTSETATFSRASSSKRMDVARHRLECGIASHSHRSEERR